MFCSQCGNKNEESAKFCAACGNPMNNEMVNGEVEPVPVAQNMPVESVTPVPVQPQSVAPVTSVNPMSQPVAPVQPMNPINPMPQPVAPMAPINPVPPMGPPINNGAGYVPPKKNPVGAAAIIGLLVVVGLVIFLAARGLGGDGTKKRTMMIYISASNLESEVAAVTSDLNSIIPSKVDLNNMNVVIYAGGTKLWHNGFDTNENAIYELTKDGLKKKKSYQVMNMSLPSTLSDFLNYAYTNYKADKYDLVVYSHGGAWQGAIIDDHYPNSFMQLSHFREAFEGSPFKGENKLEGIIFRTCLNGNYEVATVLKDYAQYMVASEEMTLGGSSIHVLDFLNDITGDMDFITVGNKFEESYYNNTVNTFAVKTSSDFRNMVMAYATIDLSKMNELEREVGNFFENININTNYHSISRVRNGLYQYALYGEDGEVFDVVDLYKLVDNLKNVSTYGNNKLLSAFENVVVSCYTNTAGKNNSKCMSIYFPYRAKKEIKTTYVNYYTRQNFDTKYSQFVKDFNFKQTSAGTSAAMLQLDNGHFKNSIAIINKILKLQLTDEEKDDIVAIKYHVFKKNGNNYREIKYSDKVVLNGNDLTINLKEEYMKLNDEYIYVDYFNDSYRAFGYLTKEDEVLDTDKVTYGFDDDGKLTSATKRSKTGNSTSMVLLDLDEYDKYYFSTYNYGFNKVDQEWKSKVQEEKVDFEKDSVNTQISELENGDYYFLLEVYDTNNNVHYTSLNKIK